MPKVFNASSQQLSEYFREEREGEMERIRNALKRKLVPAKVVFLD